MDSISNQIKSRDKSLYPSIWTPVVLRRNGMIIGVSGKARSGKDTLFSIAQKDGFVRLSFAEELKRRAREDFGLTSEHTDGSLKETPLEKLQGHSTREFLIELGNLYRKYRPSFWVDIILDKIRANPTVNYMITDVRYPNEADALDSVDGIIVRLERHPDRDGLVDEKTKQSISETALDSYTGFKYVVPGDQNRVTQDLEFFWDIIKTVEEIKGTGQEKSNVA